MLTFKQFFTESRYIDKKYHSKFTTKFKLSDRQKYFNKLNELNIFSKLNSRPLVSVASLPDTYEFERMLLQQITAPVNIYGVDYVPEKAFKNAKAFLKVNTSQNLQNIFTAITRRKIVKFEDVLTKQTQFINVSTKEIVTKPNSFDVIDYDTTTTALPEVLDAIEYAYKNSLSQGGFIHVTFTNNIRDKSYIGVRSKRSLYDEEDVINTSEPDNADFYEIPQDVYIDENNIQLDKQLANSLMQIKNANFTTSDLIGRGLNMIYANLYLSRKGNTFMYSGVAIK